MAFKQSATTETNNAQAQATGNGRAKQEVLGYLNIGLPTKTPGKFRRVESVRLIKGNPIHEQVFNHLNLSKADDDLSGLDVDQVNALYKERIARLQEMLQLTFNPSPDAAESELDL